MNWAELLERLKGAKGLTDKQVAAMEKRHNWRVFRKIKLKASRPTGETLDLVATNFGPGGMRAETEGRLKKDDRLSIQFTVGPAGSIITSEEYFNVKVVWVRRRKSDSVHEVGLAFSAEDADHRLSAARFLLEECNVSIQNPREKRTAPRVAAERMSAVFATPDGEISTAQVVDLAVGGVQLLSPRAVSRGTELDLRITMAPDLPPLVCKGTVLRASREGQLRTVELGVAFTEVPPDHKDRLVSFLSRLLRAN